MKPTRLLTWIWIALLAMPLLCACSKDSDPEADDEELDTTPTGVELPVTDEMKTTIFYPATVIGGNFNEIGMAIERRLEQKTTLDDASLKIVFMDNATASNLDKETYAKIKKVYDAGGAVIVTDPTKALIQKLGKEIGDIPSDADDDPDNSDKPYGDIFACTKIGGELHLDDLFSTDEQDAIETDAEGNTTESKEAGNITKQTEYHYGLYADAVSTWIMQNITSMSMGGGSSDIHSLATAQTQTYLYYPTYYDDPMSKDKSALYQVTYYVYCVYSFDQDMDYYMVHQEIIGNNETMMQSSKWKEGKWQCYGFYLGKVESTHDILKPNRSKFTPSEVYVHDPTPATSQDSYSVSSGYSVSWGGNIGLSTSGPDAGLNTGGSISESYTMNIPDVSIENKSLNPSGSGQTHWIYNVANAKVTSNGFKGKLGESPLVSRKTITLHNCWYWTVKNPKQYSGRFIVEFKNKIMFSKTRLKNNTFSYEYETYRRGYTYSNSFMLNPPNRTRTQQ